MPSGLCICELKRFIKTSLNLSSAGLGSEGLGSLSAYCPHRGHAGTIRAAPAASPPAPLMPAVPHSPPSCLGRGFPPPRAALLPRLTAAREGPAAGGSCHVLQWPHLAEGLELSPPPLNRDSQVPRGQKNE